MLKVSSPIMFNSKIVLLKYCMQREKRKKQQKQTKQIDIFATKQFGPIAAILSKSFNTNFAKRRC